MVHQHQDYLRYLLKFQTDGCQVEECKKGEGIKKCYWQVQKSNEDKKYGIGNTVNNIIMIMYGVKWVLETSGGTVHINV